MPRLFVDYLIAQRVPYLTGVWGHGIIGPPQHFRSGDAFRHDLDKVIDTLHDSRRAKPEQPVLVAGHPEQATRAHRLSEGTPIPDDLMVHLRAVVDRVQVPVLLAP